VLGGPQLQSFGEVASGRVIALDRREAKPSEAEQLALAAGTRIYHLTRVRLLSGHPVMIERSAFPDPPVRGRIRLVSKGPKCPNSGVSAAGSLASAHR
jgi:DNA-binding GntR family transcriptional regulator